MGSIHHEEQPDISHYEQLLATRTSSEWSRAGQEHALAVFHMATVRVPAYRDFLRLHGVDPKGINTIADFHARVPMTTKENYINAYPLAERCLNGKLAAGSIVSYSSGSTGAPTLWPRFEVQEEESVLLHHLLLRSQFAIQERRTLIVVCFAIGIHIAGVITTAAIERLLGYGYPMSLVTPGKNKDDVLDIIERLGPQYDQVILFGHPGFLKIIIGMLRERQYAFEKQDWGLVTSGNGFFEDWRDHMLSGMGQHQRPESIVSLYGCTDMGMIGHETPMTIATRRSLHIPDSRLAPLLDLDSAEPFLFQYLPTHRYIEAVDGELVFTAATGVPLIRYTMHDRGSVHAYADIMDKEHSVRGATDNQLPLVALYGRSRSIIVNGANIYAEDIQRIVEHPSVSTVSTGKFFHTVEYTATFDERFTIYIELHPGMSITIPVGEEIKQQVIISLQLNNKEYADCLRALGELVHPVIIFCAYGDEKLSGKAADAKKKL